MKVILLLLSFAASAALAQEVPPEIKPLSEKYGADLGVVEKARTAALDAAKKPYLAALDLSDQKATLGGKTEVLKIVLEEKELIMTDAALPPVPPAALPRDLHGARTTYIKEVARIAGIVLPRVRQASTDYIRALGALELKAKGNSGLLLEIGKEKLRVSEGATTGAAQQTKNIVVNPDFTKKDEGWIPRGNIEFLSEGATTFVRVKSQGPSQHIDCPAGVKELQISFKVRAKGTTTPREYGVASISGVGPDGKGVFNKTMAYSQQLVGDWKEFHEEVKLKSPVQKLTIEINGFSGAEIDFTGFIIRAKK